VLLSTLPRVRLPSCWFDLVDILIYGPSVQRFSKRPSNTVIAIDLATTRSCLAIGQRLLLEDHNITPPDVKLYTCWTDAYEAGSKWPITAMLYNSQGVPSTGNDLEMAFKSRASRNFDMNKHFRQWKLLFHDDQSDVAIKRIQDELYSKLSLLEKTRLQLLQDWVKLIYTDLLKAQGNGLYSLNDSIGSFDKQDIEIVVTVPPGRSVWRVDLYSIPVPRQEVLCVRIPIIADVSQVSTYLDFAFIIGCMLIRSVIGAGS
jgi:hypothetical protein